MPRANSLEQARRRAYFAAVDQEAYRLTSAPRNAKISNPWRALSPADHDAYLSGKHKAIGGRAEAFDLAYVYAAQVRDSEVWDALDEHSSPQAIAVRLHSLTRKSVNDVDTRTLVRQVAAGHFLDPAEASLGDLSHLLCALRLSRADGDGDLSVDLALLLASRLLHLSGWESAGVSQEVWELSRRFVRGLAYDGCSLVFRDATWKLVSRHVSAITYRLNQYAFPGSWVRHTLQPSTRYDVLREFVAAFATKDRNRLLSMLLWYRDMSPGQDPLAKVPDADEVGLWEVKS